MPEDPEPPTSDPLQSHVPEKVGHCVVPEGNSCRNWDAVELLAHHLSY